MEPAEMTAGRNDGQEEVFVALKALKRDAIVLTNGVIFRVQTEKRDLDMLHFIVR
jgi:hypothetical protein